MSDLMCNPKRLYKQQSAWWDNAANLLVVNLLVTPYNQERGGSRQILPWPGTQGAGASEEAWILAGRHDLLRLLRATLAAGRRWPSDYRHYAAAYLRGFRHID